MEETIDLSNAKTKIQSVTKTLKAYINSIKRKRLITLKGTFNFDSDLDSLRNRKSFDF